MAQRVSLVGDDHGGSEDYATLALWWTAESSTDYGSQIEAVCSGSIGSISTGTGATPQGYSIYAKFGEAFNGTNKTTCPQGTTLNFESPNGLIDGLFCTAGGTPDPLDLRADNLTASNMYIQRTAGGSTTVDFNTTHTTKLLKNSVVDCVGANHGIRLTSSANHYAVENVVVFGATLFNFSFNNSTTPSTLIDCFAFGGGTDYSTGGTYIRTTCASEDLTGTSGLTGFTSSELVDFAGGDYRTKATSTLATAGTGAQGFIGAFLELSAGISVTGVYYQTLMAGN